MNFDIRQQANFDIRYRRNRHHHIHKRIDYIQDRIDHYQVESHNNLDIESWRFRERRDALLYVIIQGGKIEFKLERVVSIVVDSLLLMRILHCGMRVK